MISLAAGAWRAQLRPEIGGSIAALSRSGIPILRSMPDMADQPLQAACFPLVPYANRIAQGRFARAGRAVHIAPNLAGHAHPLHGMGWLSAWRVVRSDGASALMEHLYAGTAEWPWAYAAHQHVALDDGGCTVRLMVQNCAPEPQPVGLGLHPYFRRNEDTRIRFEARAMLGIDGDCLADGNSHPAGALADWTGGTALPDCLVDHCFTGWGGTATIADRHGTITLRGFGAPHCHLYAPPGEDILCIEPVSHPPDALNRSAGDVTVLPPGCAAGIAMRIEAAPPPSRAA